MTELNEAQSIYSSNLKCGLLNLVSLCKSMLLSVFLSFLSSFWLVNSFKKKHLTKYFNFKKFPAGQKTDEAEIERMIESGNPQIFTEGV